MRLIGMPVEEEAALEVDEEVAEEDVVAEVVVVDEVSVLVAWEHHHRQNSGRQMD
jgi:hypothetical protein